MASNNRQPAAAHERKTDRTHVSEGQRRASQAAEQRRRQAQAERERVERANEEMRAQRRERPDPIDTSYQIDTLGGVGVEGQHEHVYVPYSTVQRNYTENRPETNVALASGQRGSIQPQTKSLLIGEDGTPRQRDNMLQRLDPTYRATEEAYQWALRKFAQMARGNPKVERRWLVYRLDQQGVKLGLIAGQVGVSKAQAGNYLSDARHLLRGLIEGRRDAAS